MPITDLEHCLVLTDDLDGTLDFYSRALGLRVGPRPPLDFPGYWLYAAAAPCIHVAEWESYRAHSSRAGIAVSTRAPGTGPVDHIAFNAVDCDAVKARLAAYGARYAENEGSGGGAHSVVP